MACNEDELANPFLQGIADYGIIEHVEMIDFMCHKVRDIPVVAILSSY